MRPVRAALALLAILAGPAAIQAAPLFEDDAPIDITLAGPLSATIEDTTGRREQAFSLTVDGEAFDVAVRVRGKSRVEYCRFPPLRLNFARKDVADSVLAGQDKLKLVTHCKGSAEYEQNLLEEYAAYRILNVLTDISFRPRLLRVRYVDTDDAAADPITRYAFFVESDQGFAARVGGDPLLVRDVARSLLDSNHAALVYVFHYLIGNTDWSLVRYYHDEFCCHNGKLFTVGGNSYYVPYDFDMSGLVGARYAKPQPELRLRSVRTRRYRGYCTDDQTRRTAIRAVVERREAILKVISELPGLTDKNRQRQYRYIEDFFKAAENEDKLVKEFARRCL
ncbi:MAG: hypothetical protein WBN07_04460 [Woeseiaceae bacterium]